jgi:endonuclease YncB( thermonuclease family)
MKKRNLLIILILLFFTINYPFFNAQLIKTFDNSETGFVERVIDGDTIVMNGTSIRLLGINSPERGEPFYQESKKFLEDKILNKKVELHFGPKKFDKYRRKLAYIFYHGENINLESVKKGYSNYYFPAGKDNYYNKFVNAWDICLQNKNNLCKKSKEKCIILEEWDIKNQKVTLKNICSKKIDITGWSIKDEGRKKYIFSTKILFPQEEISLIPENWNKDYIWTKTGDSLIFRDSNNSLILFESY